MNRFNVWVISPKALRVLLENELSGNSVPTAWSRVTLIPQENQEIWLEQWHVFNAIGRGLGTGIILSVDDDVLNRCNKKKIGNLKVLRLIGTLKEREELVRELSD